MRARGRRSGAGEAGADAQAEAPWGPRVKGPGRPRVRLIASFSAAKLPGTHYDGFHTGFRVLGREGAVWSVRAPGAFKFKLRVGAASRHSGLVNNLKKTTKTQPG